MFDSEEIQVRSAPVVEIERDTGIVTAKLVPYGIEAQLDSDLFEVFTEAAFGRSISNPSRIKMTDQAHNRAVVIGHALELRDESDGVYGRLKVSDTSAGRDCLTLMRDGALTDLSVEFKPQRRYMRVTRRANGILVRHDRGVLVGVSPVAVGAYGEAARVLSIRDEASDKARDAAIARLSALNASPTRV